MNLAHNDYLREQIVKRIKEVFRYNAHLIKDAEKRGMNISMSRLSKYLKGHSGGITEDQILWVATRLGIYVTLDFGKPVMKDNKLTYEITPYNEEEALQHLNKIFKNG